MDTATAVFADLGLAGFALACEMGGSTVIVTVWSTATALVAPVAAIAAVPADTVSNRATKRPHAPGPASWPSPVAWMAHWRVRPCDDEVVGQGLDPRTAPKRRRPTSARRARARGSGSVVAGGAGSTVRALARPGLAPAQADVAGLVASGAADVLVVVGRPRAAVLVHGADVRSPARRPGAVGWVGRGVGLTLAPHRAVTPDQVSQSLPQSHVSR